MSKYIVRPGSRRAYRNAPGQTRFKVSLQTGNLAEANRLKHSHVAEFLRRIDALEKSFDPKAEVMKDAKEWRAELATASKAENEYGASIYGELLDQVKELSRQLAEKDEALAHAFHHHRRGDAAQGPLPDVDRGEHGDRANEVSARQHDATLHRMGWRVRHR